jgi:hypothetical protein
MNRLEGAAQILGGLPVFARCWFSRGHGLDDDDCGVDSMHWLKRDGTAGAELPQSVIDRLDKKQPYWEADVCEQVVESYHYAKEADSAGVFEFAQL